MSMIDWAIVLIPLALVIYSGFYSRKYIRGVADYLSAGRVCGRYVICVGDTATALSIIGLVAFVEVQYKAGFALTFWQNLLMPVGIIMALTGYCVYRFRETRAMSIGQFLEMRYSRNFRIFAALLRSIAEMLANMIMPAIGARFFIYFLDLPRTVTIFGFVMPTFMLLMFIILTIAVSLICMGGTLALVITNAFQGMVCAPLLLLFTIYIFCKFSWENEIVAVMMDRAAGESFLNPYDISKLEDFNVVFLIVMLFSTIIHRASWLGSGITSAAKSPHEQKMAGILGTVRNAQDMVFYALIAITVLTVMNHADFSGQARDIRIDICRRVAYEVAGTPECANRIIANIEAIPVQKHIIGKDAPASKDNNQDTVYLNTVHQTLLEANRLSADEFAAETARLQTGSGLTSAEAAASVKASMEKDGNARFQEFRTLYHQLLTASTMRSFLGTGLLGLFCLLMVLAMVSTDDTRIYSASLTIAQDVILPFFKDPLPPEKHVWLIRIISIGVGVFFFCGSFFMAQLDYINLFTTLVITMWQGGCGPVMIFGLYSRFGTTAGAWTSLLTGMFMAFGGIFVQRNWADTVYPFIVRCGYADEVDRFLRTVSAPLNPYVDWKLNALKCPVNSYEFYFITMIVTLILYIVVSKLTCRELYDLDRLLHRGKYKVEDDEVPAAAHNWSIRNIFSQLISITPEYTRGDRWIAWGLFIYSFVYQFVIAFVLVVVWNVIAPWKLEWWGTYFWIVTLFVPGCAAFITTLWFGIGGFLDIFRMFRDLKMRIDNPLDNGQVNGQVSLADQAAFDQVEETREEQK